MVRNNNGEIRICLDPWAVNERMAGDQEQSIAIDELLTEVE